MNTLTKLATVSGLAVTFAFSALAATPAAAAPPFVRHAQQRHAARLDRQARRAAINGNYRRAHRLRHQATRLRAAARHGF